MIKQSERTFINKNIFYDCESSEDRFDLISNHRSAGFTVPFNSNLHHKLTLNLTPTQNCNHLLRFFFLLPFC